jgi:cytochrome c oxidase cbb3-type subunit III
MRWLNAVLAAALSVGVTVPLAAQVDPEYIIPKTNPNTSPADLAQGERLFKGQCAGCHGPKGEGGRGAVLAQPRLRRAADDESLFRTIRDGVRGTEMPAADTITSREIWQIAAYVRSLGRLPAEIVPGDPKRGENLYRTKGNCAQCHIVNGEGGSLGPELTEIGARRGAARLRSTVLDPASTLPEGFLQVRLVTKDGRRISGVRLNEDTFTIQLRDLNGGVYSFIKQDLKEFQREPGKTPMPSFRGVLSDGEIDDLIAYLVSLRGRL